MRVNKLKSKKLVQYIIDTQPVERVINITPKMHGAQVIDITQTNFCYEMTTAEGAKSLTRQLSKDYLITVIEQVEASDNEPRVLHLYSLSHIDLNHLRDHLINYYGWSKSKAAKWLAKKVVKGELR